MIKYNRLRKDQFWKSGLEKFFKPAMVYIYGAEASAAYDLDHPEFLDKEMATIMPEGLTRQRIADKLIRVKKNDGTELWVIFHIEVQGKADKHFDERMFTMFYRIRDRFGHRVAAVAILTDKSDKFRPGRLEEETLDTGVVYYYPTLKLKDYQPDELLQGSNPFGIILQVAWYHLYGSKNDQQKLASKLELARRLFAAGLSAEDTRLLYGFIKYYTGFNDNTNYGIFDEQIAAEFKEEIADMELREHILWAVREEGRDVGREEGREAGREDSLAQTAKLMLTNNEPIDKIMLYTGLAKADIEKLVS